MAVQDSYSNYATTGTGIILFDGEGLGPANMAGELNNRTIVFNP